MVLLDYQVKQVTTTRVVTRHRTQTKLSDTYKETTDMSVEQNKAIARRLFESVAAGAETALDELLAPDFVAHQPGTSTLLGVEQLSREEFLQALRASNAAFSDQQYTIEDQVAEGDRVTTRVSWRATHSGDFQGVPATGERVVGGGIAIERIKDGKIAERWAQPDRLGLMQQLGIVPSPGQSG
jgi:steroid delta-isomerase-like uncharacterized protein